MGMLPQRQSLGYRFVLKMGLMLLPLFMVVWISVSSLRSQRQSLDLILQEVLHEKETVMVIQAKVQKAVSLLFRHLLAGDNGGSDRQFEILKGEIDALLIQQRSLEPGPGGELEKL